MYAATSAKPRSAARFSSPTRVVMLGALALALHGAIGANSARAAGQPRVVSVRQNGNNVIVTYSIPSNTPGFSKIQTRWNGPGTNTKNEHQQLFKLGFGTRFTYMIPNVQSNQRYVFKVQGYSSIWSSWKEVRFTTKGITYVGPLTTTGK